METIPRRHVRQLRPSLSRRPHTHNPNSKYTQEGRLRNLESMLKQDLEGVKSDLRDRLKQKRKMIPGIFMTSRGKSLACYCLDYVLKKESMYCPDYETFREYNLTGTTNQSGILNLTDLYKHYLDWLHLSEDKKRNRRIMTAITSNDASIFGYQGITDTVNLIIANTRLTSHFMHELYLWADKDKLFNWTSPSGHVEYPITAITRLKVTAQKIYPDKFNKQDYTPERIKEIFWEWNAGKMKNLPKDFFNFAMATKFRIFFEEYIKSRGFSIVDVYKAKPDFSERFNETINRHFQSYPAFLEFIYGAMFKRDRFQKKMQKGRKLYGIEKIKDEQRQKACKDLEGVLKKENALRLTGPLSDKYDLRNHYRTLFDNVIDNFNQYYERNHLKLTDEQIKHRTLLFRVFDNKDYSSLPIDLSDILKKANLSTLESQIFGPAFLENKREVDLAKETGLKISVVNSAVYRIKCKLVKSFNLCFPETFREDKSDEELRQEMLGFYNWSLRNKRNPDIPYLGTDFKRKVRFLIDYVLEKEKLKPEDLPKVKLKELFQRHSLYRLSQIYCNHSPAELLTLVYPELKPFQFELKHKWKNMQNVLDFLNYTVRNEGKRRGIDTTELDEQKVRRLLKNHSRDGYYWPGLFNATGWTVDQVRDFYSLMSGKVKLGRKGVTLDQVLDNPKDITLIGTKERVDWTKKLFTYYNAFRDDSIPHKIALLNQPLVKGFILRTTNPPQDVDDLKSSIMKWLVDVVKRNEYDPKKGEPSTYFFNQLKGARSDYYRWNRIMHPSVQVVSLSDPIKGSDTGTVEDFLSAEPKFAVDPYVSEILYRFMEKLPANERNIVALRFGLMDGRKYTLDQIGTFYSMTRERVRQIEEASLSKLRKSILQQNPDISARSLHNQ